MARLHFDYDPLTGHSIPNPFVSGSALDMPEGPLSPPDPTPEERRAELAEEIAENLADPAIRDKCDGWYGDGWLEMAAGIVRDYLPDLDGGPLGILRQALKDRIAEDDELVFALWYAARDSLEDSDVAKSIDEAIKERALKMLEEEARWEAEEKAVAAAGY